MSTKSDLALYFGQDLITAGRMTLSEVNALFESSSYQNWKKSQENQAKNISTAIGGIGNIIKGLSMLGRVFGERKG